MNKTKTPIARHTKRPWVRLIIEVTVALCIIIFLEIIAFNHNKGFDLTPDSRYSISAQTRKILKALDRDIQFTVFYGHGERKNHEDLFRRLSDCSSHVKYRLVDLDRNPGQARLHGIAANGQTIAESGSKKKMVEFPTEDKIINAVLMLTREREQKIYFTEGHGENELKREYRALSKALKAEGWQVEALNLSGKEGVPAGASVLIVGGPKTDFFDSQLQAIAQFIQRGGKVVFMVEPFSTLPRLNGFLKKYGIILGAGVIIDKDNKLFGGDYLVPLIPYFAKGPITGSITSPCVFPTACSVEIEIEGRKEAGAVLGYLARSSRESWLKKVMDEKEKGKVDFQPGVDVKGPIPVAVLVTTPGSAGKDGKKGPEGTIVCFGDSDFVNDEFIDMGANKDLFLNTVDWLAQEKDLISVRPKKYEYPFHHMTEEQGRWSFWFPVVIVPCIFLMIGVGILMYRRWRG